MEGLAGMALFFFSRGCIAMFGRAICKLEGETHVDIGVSRCCLESSDRANTLENARHPSIQQH
jgi:hypothetical protein